VEAAELALLLEGIDLRGAKRYKRWRAKSHIREKLRSLSHYVTSAGIRSRRWEYALGDPQLRQWRDVRPTSKSPGTVVSLRRFRKDYETRTPKRPETIAYRIIEHFLVCYVLETLPDLIIKEKEGSEVFDAHTIYKSLIVRSEAGTCSLGDATELSVKYLLLRHHSELPGGIVYSSRLIACVRLVFGRRTARGDKPRKALGPVSLPGRFVAGQRSTRDKGVLLTTAPSPLNGGFLKIICIPLRQAMQKSSPTHLSFKRHVSLDDSVAIVALVSAALLGDIVPCAAVRIGIPTVTSHSKPGRTPLKSKKACASW
jgi:hypothetical protein